MNIKTIILTIIFTLCLSVAAEAALMRYDNQITFADALTDDTVITFEGLSGNQGTNLSIANVDFDVPRASYVYNIEAPSNYLVAANSGEVYIRLDQGSHALGMEIGWLWSDPHSIRYYLVGTEGILENGDISPFSVNQFNTVDTFFIGWTSDDAEISYLALLPDDSSYYIAVDNVTCGSPVPIPGAMWLFISGLFMFKRKFKKIINKHP